MSALRKYRAAAICIILCKRCGKACAYCGSVSRWGELVNVLYLFAEFMKETETGSLNPLQWNGALSIGQELAAQGVIEAIKQKESFYLGCVRGWKTEMLFYGIEEALQKGERVCIATPRTDVVLELAPRLQEVFPSITVAALYGGSVDHKRCSVSRCNDSPTVTLL